MKEKIIEILNNYVDLSAYARGGVDKKILKAIATEIESICYPKEFTLWCMLNITIIREPLRFEVKNNPILDFYELNELYLYWKNLPKNKDK